MSGSVAVVPQGVLQVLPLSVRIPQAAEILAECGAYRVRLAMDDDDRHCLYRLRFLVFNLELNEGLDTSYLDGLDRDQFDAVCDHLMVEHRESGRVVGTYRLQTGRIAERHFGYYSAQEFDFSPYEPLRDEVVECGRACIHRDFRSFEVLNLLWRGIAQYAKEHGGRYLIGCSSVASQDAGLGSALYYRLKDFLVEPELRTMPTEAYAFELAGESDEKPSPPKLLRAYLAVGARIGGPPALDREFKTMDFLTLLDLERMAPSARAHYLR